MGSVSEALVDRSGWRPLPMFPLSIVLFPRARLPLHVFEARYRQLMSECLAGDSRFGIVLITRGSEVGGGDKRADVGTRAVITHAAPLADGRSLVVVEGEARIRIGEWLADDPYPQALVEPWPPRPGGADTATLQQAVNSVRRVRGLLSEAGRSPALPGDLQLDDEPDVASWQLCAEVPFNTMDAQRLLSVADTAGRLTLLTELSEAMAKDLMALLASG